MLAESDYSYFNSQTPGNNLWAGAAHWKRAPASSKKAVTAKKKKTKKAPSKKKAAAKQQLVPFPDELPDVSHLLAGGSKKKKKGSKGKASTTTTQWSKAMVTKHTNQDNLLPPDAEFKVEQLTQLFLLPNTVLANAAAAHAADDNNNDTVNKTVNFHLPDWDDGSFGGGGGDDDGPGFDFGGGDDDMHDDDDDEFLVQHELEGVRKVDKVQVGYAVVAKKVDVKRLKRDLWAELEQTFAGNKTKSDEDDDDEDSVDSETNEEQEENNGMSFQDAVHDLEQQKTQMDVTLPFYFICILHLANEKGLRLMSQGLDDFTIHNAAS